MNPVNHAPRPTVAPAHEADRDREKSTVVPAARGGSAVASACAWTGGRPCGRGRRGPCNGGSPCSGHELRRRRHTPAAEAAPGAAKAAPEAAAKHRRGRGRHLQQEGADTCMTCHDDAHVMACSRPGTAIQTMHAAPSARASCSARPATVPEESTPKMKKGEPRPPMIRRPRLRRAGRCAERRVPQLPREIDERQLASGSARRQQGVLRVLPRTACGQRSGQGARTQADVYYTCHVDKRMAFLKP